MKKWLFGWRPLQLDFGLLVLRVFLGFSMAYAHGWPKLASFSEKADGFPAVFGLPGEVSLAFAVFAEFFCSILLALGLASRFALILLIITMAVAAFDIHLGDDYATKEKALLYLAGYLALFLAGPGKMSFDKLTAKG